MRRLQSCIGRRLCDVQVCCSAPPHLLFLRHPCSPRCSPRFSPRQDPDLHAPCTPRCLLLHPLGELRHGMRSPPHGPCRVKHVPPLPLDKELLATVAGAVRGQHAQCVFEVYSHQVGAPGPLVWDTGL